MLPRYHSWSLLSAFPSLLGPYVLSYHRLRNIGTGTPAFPTFKLSPQVSVTTTGSLTNLPPLLLQVFENLLTSLSNNLKIEELIKVLGLPSSLILSHYQFAMANLHILMFNLNFGLLPLCLPAGLCFPVFCRLSAQISDQGAITVSSSFSCCIFQHQEDRLHKRCLKSLDIAVYHCIPWTHSPSSLST